MDLIAKKYLNITSLSILILFSSQNMAASITEAVNASKNNEVKKAVKLWTQLANSGNTIAQYNLAIHYSDGNGVQKNSQLANQWLKSATHSGLVQAYLSLNKQAIAPANGMTISFKIGPEYWLQKQKPNKYTIQLSSSRNEKSIKKSYVENDIKGNGGYYQYTREGVDRYALIYGVYKTVAAAKVAITKLPENLRAKTPWVRKIKTLQQISK